MGERYHPLTGGQSCASCAKIEDTLRTIIFTATAARENMVSGEVLDAIVSIAREGLSGKSAQQR